MDCCPFSCETSCSTTSLSDPNGPQSSMWMTSELSRISRIWKTFGEGSLMGGRPKAVAETASATKHTVLTSRHINGSPFCSEGRNSIATLDNEARCRAPLFHPSEFDRVLKGAREARAAHGDRHGHHVVVAAHPEEILTAALRRLPGVSESVGRE